jgi:uncharacterized protein YukE
MANIRLNPEELESIRQNLIKAGTEMENSVQQTLTELGGIKEQLAGYTNETWVQWQVEFDKRHRRLQDDYQQGVAILAQMGQEIVEGDQGGRQYFSV